MTNSTDKKLTRNCFRHPTYVNKKKGFFIHLKGKAVVITGATGAIGSATAKRFIAEGANVVLVGRSNEKIRSLSNPLNHSKAITAYVAEAFDEAAVKQSLDYCICTFGGHDVVFANAGTKDAVKSIDA